MNQVRGIIFDMDGLIFDSERICYKAYLRAAHKFGFQMNELVHLDLTGRVEEGVIAETSRLFGEDKDVLTWRAFIREQKVAVLEEQGGRVGKKAGLLDLLSYLHERDIPYALASSSVRSTIDRYLAGEYLVHDFPVIMDGSQVSHGKPDPEIFLKAAKLIGVDPGEALVLEDSRAGIRAANAGGFTSGFVYDDLSDLETVTDGYPILVDLDGPESLCAEADLSFKSLASVIDFIESTH